MHGQKGFHQGHGNLVWFERHHGAIAADDLVAGKRGGGSMGGLAFG
jgi:hypothetical protein